jgi:hypothetical protein
MGFKAKRKIYKLKFADEDLAGLEVMARSVSLGQMLDLSSSEGVGKVDRDDAEQTNGMFDLFVSALVSWNLEEEDEDGNAVPVPPTLSGLRAQDTEFAMSLVNAWAEAISSVSAPLAKPSNSGETPPEASLPMEAL